LGLNPHCGDGGVIGKEDDDPLKPVLKSALRELWPFFDLSLLMVFEWVI
jgi:4-hydroxy-L-threonine phosphate dehydrogenase PdxA